MKKRKTAKIPHGRPILVLLAIVLVILVLLVGVLVTPSTVLDHVSFLGPAKHALTGSRVTLTSALVATALILITLVLRLQ